jgi:UDP-2,3-diacylglucosamine pyrophosphatase LpxH
VAGDCTFYRSLFLSDIHLGNPGCQASLLLSFLRQCSAETIFLVGDIVDAESMARRFYWPRLHNEVLRSLHDHHRRGSRLVYIPGNHDAQARVWCGMTFGHIEIRRHLLHTTAAGKRYLVMHGDRFDRRLDRHTWRNSIGAYTYRHLVRLNAYINTRREREGRAYWPLASVIKHRSSAARRYIENFRATALMHAADRNLDGCIVGHIHRPEILQDGKVHYMNCGDWVEHCTALAEHADGHMELIDWPSRLTVPADPSNRLLPQVA